MTSPMTQSINLPVVDLSAPDSLAAARTIRQACVEFGFFYLVNHGVEEELIRRVFEDSRRFFALPIDEKMKLLRKEYRGYTPLYAENLDPASGAGGDSKESYYIGPLENCEGPTFLNQWPSNVILPSWRPTMESYYRAVESTGKKLLGLIAVSLDLDENFFVNLGMPDAFLRLLRYPGDIITSDKVIYGASAHSDYGMITLLATDSVPGLQVCRDKSMQLRTWEDVPHVDGLTIWEWANVEKLRWKDVIYLDSRGDITRNRRAFIVNIGDMMERWTNCLFRSTLHRVMPSGQERFSVAFFLDPSMDCVVECLPSCCSDSSPPRFPPIKMGEYLTERFGLTYGTD